MQSDVPEKTKHNPNSRVLKGTLLAAGTLTVMASATISPALPAITEAFTDTPNIDLLVSLLLTIPALFIALGAPLAGVIVDRFGRKRLLVIAVTIYGFAGSAGFVLDGIWQLLFSRALLGFSVAGVLTCVTTLIADYYKGQERSAFLGIQAAFAGLGGVIFLSAGGFLADVGWREPFLIYLLAFVILPFVITALYEPQIPKQKNTVEMADLPEASLPIMLMAFIYTSMAISQIAFYSIPLQLPFYLDDLINASASQVGLAIAGLSLFYSIASASYGWIDRHLNHLNTLMLGFATTGVGFVLITTATGWLTIAPGLVLSGFGLGLVIPNLNTWLANVVPVALRGRALGGLTTALFFGQFLSPFVVTPIRSVAGDGGVYAVIGIGLIVLASTGFLLRQRITLLTAAPSYE
ncbi:MAG: MFS transporter [Chloroflexota bacterium]